MESSNGKGIKLIHLILIAGVIMICIGGLVVTQVSKKGNTETNMDYAIDNGEAESEESNDEEIVEDKKEKSAYDGTKEMGKKVEFEIKEVELPKAPDWSNEGEFFKDEYDDSWNYDLDAEGNAINVHGYLYSFTGDVTIPDTIDGHKVISLGKGPGKYAGSNTEFFETSINGEAYWNNITSLTIPEGVKYINKFAFMGLENLESVTLPESLIYLGDNAFSHNKNLSRINSDNEGEVILPSNLQYLGEEQFQYNDKITSVKFPETINYIPDFIFSECEGITEFIVPEHIEYIGYGAFSRSKLNKITLGENVKIIDHSAFSTTELKEVTLPDSVVSIGTWAFYFTPLEKFEYNGKLDYIGTAVFDYTKIENPLKNSQLPK